MSSHLENDYFPNNLITLVPASFFTLCRMAEWFVSFQAFIIILLKKKNEIAARKVQAQHCGCCSNGCCYGRVYTTSAWLQISPVSLGHQLL